MCNHTIDCYDDFKLNGTDKKCYTIGDLITIFNNATHVDKHRMIYWNANGVAVSISLNHTPLTYYKTIAIFYTHKRMKEGVLVDCDHIIKCDKYIPPYNNKYNRDIYISLNGSLLLDTFPIIKCLRKTLFILNEGVD